MGHILGGVVVLLDGWGLRGRRMIAGRTTTTTTTTTTGIVLMVGCWVMMMMMWCFVFLLLLAVTVSQSVINEFKRIIEDSEIVR